MNKRILIAGVLGALAMFFWIFIAHTVLPLGETGVRQIDHEEPLLATMKSTLPTQGMYMFPRMDAAGDQAAYAKKLMGGLPMNPATNALAGHS